MQYDQNELALFQDELMREGKTAEGIEVRQKFIDAVRESGDFCTCKEACMLHGDCFACVQVHRAHRGHLPLCMWDLVNERIVDIASLTEGSFLEYAGKHPACMNGEPRQKSGLTLETYEEKYKKA